MRIQLFYPPAEIVHELCQQGHCVSAWNTLIDPHEVLTYEGRLKVEHLPKLSKLSRMAIQRIYADIVEFKPDVIQSFTPFALAWANLALLFLPKTVVKPKVVSFRGVTKPVSKIDPGNWLTFLAPGVHWHACESKAIQDAMIQSGFKKERCPVVYNSSKLYSATQTREAMRSTWGVGEDEFIFGSIATLRPIKGIDVLLEAISLSELQGVRWVIIGGGKCSMVDRWMQNPAVASRVKLLGSLGAASQYLSAFDAFVMPSRSEGLCRSLVEAMQAGLPSIVSDAGGMKELVRDGIDGVVVPKENPKALAQAMTALVTRNDLVAMGQSAKDQIANLCSPTVVTNRLVNVYKAALQSDR